LPVVAGHNTRETIFLAANAHYPKKEEYSEAAYPERERKLRGPDFLQIERFLHAKLDSNVSYHPSNKNYFLMKT
jgi:hypothetical protein